MQNNLSHKQTHYSHEDLNQYINEIKQRLKGGDGFLSGYSYKELINLVDELAEFDLGRFLILNRGIDGYWTEYILNHATMPKPVVNDLEKKILEEFPLVKATQERDQIFQRINQQSVKNGACIATIPSGLSREVLHLNYNNITKINLCSIDIDPQSLTLSQSRANDILSKYTKNGANISFTTELCDAWHLNYKESFDLISSNGLNIYEQSDQKVYNLFTKFYEALKPDGKLTTSFITPPNEWNVSKIDNKMLEVQKIIFVDIIAANFLVFRSTFSVIESLNQVGFKQIEIVPDSVSMFPTIIANKGC